jgi:DNA invertase Pin-like site-specific DNA recombinase
MVEFFLTANAAGSPRYGGQTLGSDRLVAVSAGMRAAKTHGTKTGNANLRPRRIFNRDEVVRLRKTGLSIERIASQMRIGVGTVVRVLQTVGKTRTA